MFWRHADRLYKVLAKAWNCSCASQHRAKILLQHRTTPDVDFLLLFLFQPTSNTALSNAWLLQDTKIKMSDIPPASAPITTSIPTLQSSAPGSIPNHRTARPARPTIDTQGSRTQTRTAAKVMSR